MGFLTGLLKVLVVSGAVALYLNYGRYIAEKLFPGLEGFLRDWASLAAVLLAAYLLVKLVERRLER